MRERFQSLVAQDDEVRAHLRKVIEGLPDVDGVRKVGPNCCVVSSGLLASHNNWSASYWLSTETKRMLLGVVDSQRTVSGFIKAMDDIVLAGKIKNSYGYTEAIAPNVLAELRRVWVEGKE